MSQQPIETGVVLTTDNSQYDQAMTQSAGVTDSLATSVDTLTSKIKSVSQSAGRKLVGIAAADIATITGATVAYGAFEKQMTSLNAQAAVLNKNYTQGTKLADAYGRSVNNLRKEFGTSTSTAVQLVQTITKMSDATAPVDKLTNTFTKMSYATGEAASGLASSVLQLQRTMGAPQRDTDRYANSLTTLAANSNTSATAIADFAQQIAPVGRLVGQNTQDILGVSTAFQKAGQDGFRAATVYNKVLTDIAYATQSGSPDLQKYANFVGMTVNSFKDLTGTEKIVGFFDQVSKLGPDAITALNRMGLDGANTVKAITAVTNQTGGLASSINQSRSSMSDNSVNRGSKAALESLTHDVQKLGSEVAMTAESFGARFAPAAGVFIRSVESMASVARKAMDGPLGTLLAGAAVPAGAAAGVAGGALMAAGPLMAISGLYGLGRNSGAVGYREARAQAGGIGPRMGTEGTFLQRAVYGAGSFLGGGVTAMRGPATGPGMLNRLGGMGMTAGALGLDLATAVMFPTGSDPRGLRDPLKRPTFFKPGTLGETGARGYASLSQFVAGGGAKFPSLQDDEGGTKQFRMSLKSMGDEVNKVSKTLPTFGSGLRSALGSMAGFAGGAIGTGVGAAGAGVKGVGRLAAYTVKANPMLAAIGGLAAAGEIYSLLSPEKTPYEYQDFSGAGRPYMEAGGITPPPDYTPGLQGQETSRLSLSAAKRVDSQSRAAAGNPSHKLTNTQLYGMNREQVTTYLAANYDIYRNNPQAMYELKLDLLEKFPTEARQIIADLDKGQTGDLGSFFGSSDVNKGTNQAVGVLQDRASAAYANEGNAGFLREQGVGISTLYKQMFTKTGNTEATSGALSSAYGLDMSAGQISDLEMAAGLRSTGTRGVTSPAQVAQQEALRSKLTGDNDADRLIAITEQMPELLPTLLSQLGKNENLTGNKAEQAIRNALGGSGRGPQEARGSLTSRIGRLGAYGEDFTGDAKVQRALSLPGNVNAQYTAVNSTLQNLTDAGKSVAEIVKEMGNIKATVGDEGDPYYQIAGGVQAQAQRQLGYQMPFMRRGQRFGAQADLFAAQRGVMAGDPNRQEDMLAATDAMQGSMAEQGDYFKNLLLQQREFNISQARAQEDFGVTRERMDEQYNLSRARAQQDFHITRGQQEHDYQLARSRAEEDFSITQMRTQQSFQRSQRRGQTDFNISRRRQEQDYLHSVNQMVEQQAKSMYSIYDRVRVESSASANFLLFNAGDQLKRMRGQEQDLSKLRKSGVSDDTIQQLGLTDSANAQQLSRFVAEVAGNPEMVAEFNKMVRKRLKAAAELTKDASSNEWEEFQRQYKLARERAGDDFQRQVERSHRDFKRQMSEMEDDFRRSMNRQAEDYHTAQDRQQESFSRSMKRGAEDYAIAVDQMTDDFGKAMHRAQADMNRMAKEIGGTLEEVLVKATNKLGHTASKQAGVVLKALRDLDVDFTKGGVQLMKHASRTFGFDYKPPSFAGASNPGADPHLPENHAAGGVLKGARSIGSDNMTFYSPQHGVLNLAGGEAIMVPEWVDQVGGPNKVKEMNSKARRGYAGGGNIPATGDWNQHVTGYPWARWAGDINVPGYGDMGNPVRAWKDGVVASTQHLTSSYGNHIRINHPQSEEQTLYGHLSKIMVHVMEQVSRGQQIGNVGMTGNASGPHLHFEIKGGTGPIDMGGTATTSSLKSLLKDRYPEIEADSARITAGGGMFPDGFWSKRMNKYARQAWHKMAGSGTPNVGADDFGDANSSNQEIVRAAMRSFGWNQWPSLYQLLMHESGFNNTAQNPSSTAYGMFQFLDSTWAGVDGHKTSDPGLQSLYGMRYIKSRYTDPQGAWKWWQGHNWYGDGAIFSGAQTVGVGERGPELALPLNNGGANFLAELFKKIHVGDEAKQTNVRYSQAPAGHTHTTYQIDRSTTFTGDIVVKANTPNDLISQLRARQRTHALAQQSLGGVRS